MTTRRSPWLHVVGIGEDGLDGLVPAARAVVMAAEVVIGGDRHHRLAAEAPGQRIAWPTPWDAMLDAISKLRGRRVAVLVTGDPAWFSAGHRIARAFAGEVVVHPAPGAFGLAALRMGWALQDCTCLTIHGRPLERLLPSLSPGAHLLLLAEGPGSAAEVSRLLKRVGWGGSRVVALWNMGGPEEGRREAAAEDWHDETPPLATLAVECVPDSGHAPLPLWGLPDDAFESDGTMTKREVRALTLMRLAPAPDAILWDVGCGSGSVAVEWMRMGGRAVGIEPRADRRALAAANALALGAPDLELVAGEAPSALAGLPPPDAVFLGGGLSKASVEVAWAALTPHGRLVANAVTLESQALLLALHASRGGDLTRLAVSRAEPVGPRTAWRPLMEVMQWATVKPTENVRRKSPVPEGEHA